jgi:hypothetical protein
MEMVSLIDKLLPDQPETALLPAVLILLAALVRWRNDAAWRYLIKAKWKRKVK